MKLSILIPTIPAHDAPFKLLHESLLSQKRDDVEILVMKTPASIKGGPSTGVKRQRLLEQAQGDYIVFIDSDDVVPHYYVDEMLRACDSGADCFAINGTMTTDGAKEVQWFLSKDYKNEDVIIDGKTVYLRRTNHITGVKRSIALKAGFPNKSNAEDKAYSDRLVLMSEFKIEPPMYWYRYSRFNKQYR